MRKESGNMLTGRGFRYFEENLFPEIRDLRGATRLRNAFDRISKSGIPKINSNPTRISEIDYQNLIIIDACRFDMFRDLTGLESSRISMGSCTPEYLKKNFPQTERPVYISGNPHLDEQIFAKNVGERRENCFETVFETYNTDWSSQHNTVLPKAVIEDFKTAKRLFPNKKRIIHFMQPHYPFIESDYKKGINRNLDEDQMEKSVWELAEKGLKSHEVVVRGYKRNLKYVLEKILENKDIFEEKTILTSDHGNYVGENGFYGHPMNQNTIPCREVPITNLESIELS